MSAAEHTPTTDDRVRQVAERLAYRRWPDQTVQDDPELIDLCMDDARVALEVTREEPPQVRTAAELAALPAGAIVLTAYTFDRDKEPLILRHGPDWGLTDKHDLYWWTTDGGDQISSLDRVDDLEHLVLPATVLWSPEVRS